MMTYLPRIGLAAAGALVCTLGAANAQHRLAFSEASGIEVLTLSDSWCAERFELEFRLSADSPLRDRTQLAAFAPRLAPIFDAECPAGTEAQVRVRGQDGSSISGDTAYVMSRDAGWALQGVHASAPPEPASRAAAEAVEPETTLPTDDDSGLRADAAGGSATAEAVPSARAPQGPSVDQLVRTAQELGNEDYLAAVFHFQPQFADLSRFSNSALTLGAMFNCQLQQRASRDEFARRELDAEMAEQARRIAASSSAITSRNFVLRVTARLGDYSFETGAFPFAPLEGSWRLPGYRLERNCWATAHDSVPTSFTLEFDPASAITQIAMSEAEAQRLRAGMRNSRNLETEIVFNITGVEVNRSNAQLAAEPVAVRALLPGNRATVVEFDRAALRENIERARQAVAEAERQRREAERLARIERLESERDIQIERLRERISSTSSPMRRIVMVHGPANTGYVPDRHPSAIAARHRADEGDRMGLVMFRAGRTRDDLVEAEWPSSLRINVRDRDVETPLRRQGWYVAMGPITLDTERSERRREGGLRPALMDADWVFACRSEACEEEASSRELLDLARESVDRQIAEQIAALQAEYNPPASDAGSEAN